VFVRLARIAFWLIIGIITLAAIGATDQITPLRGCNVSVRRTFMC